MHPLTSGTLSVASSVVAHPLARNSRRVSLEWAFLALIIRPSFVWRAQWSPGMHYMPASRGQSTATASEQVRRCVAQLSATMGTTTASKNQLVSTAAGAPKVIRSIRLLRNSGVTSPAAPSRASIPSCHNIDALWRADQPQSKGHGPVGFALSPCYAGPRSTYPEACARRQCPEDSLVCTKCQKVGHWHQSDSF